MTDKKKETLINKHIQETEDSLVFYFEKRRVLKITKKMICFFQLNERSFVVPTMSFFNEFKTMSSFCRANYIDVTISFHNKPDFDFILKGGVMNEVLIRPSDFFEKIIEGVLRFQSGENNIKNGNEVVTEL